MNAREEVIYATLTPPVAILMEATHVHATAPTRGSLMASLVIVCRKFERHYLLLPWIWSTKYGLAPKCRLRYPPVANQRTAMKWHSDTCGLK